ncbi:MAG TPA: metal-dependent hydrolase [Marinagarivorans sp.]
MANFNTHIQFSTIGSGLLSTLFLSAQHLTPTEAVLCWLAGSVGGILPDIDSDNSHSLSIVFGVLSIIVCVLATVVGIHYWPLAWVWAGCALVFLAMHFVVRNIFELFTVHRGIFHSVIAALFFAGLLTAVTSQLGLRASASWFIGFFTGFGYCLHLLLDEVYAVDFMGISIKRSFGTAFKLFDYKNWKSALAFGAGIAATAIYWPSHTHFSDVVFKLETYSQMAQKIMG